MTEKRFKGFYVENIGYGISDTITKVDWLIETKGDLEGFLNVLNHLHEENEQLKQAYNDAKRDAEKKEQILKDILKDNLLIQDIEKELEE